MTLNTIYFVCPAPLVGVSGFSLTSPLWNGLRSSIGVEGAILPVRQEENSACWRWLYLLVVLRHIEFKRGSLKKAVHWPYALGQGGDFWSNSRSILVVTWHRRWRRGESWCSQHSFVCLQETTRWHGPTRAQWLGRLLIGGSMRSEPTVNHSEFSQGDCCGWGMEVECL